MPVKLTSTFDRTDDPRLQPAYTVLEAAHYLRMPPATLRSWVSGRLYPVSGQQRRSSPVIHPDDPKRLYLSFINLVEAHVLAAIRRHGVRLPEVRSALDYVRRQFHVERPLVDQTFQTDGLDLFVERYGHMINASRQCQQRNPRVREVEGGRWIQPPWLRGRPGRVRLELESCAETQILAYVWDTGGRSDREAVMKSGGEKFASEEWLPGMDSNHN